MYHIHSLKETAWWSQCSSPPHIHSVTFHSFSYLKSNVVQKYEMENSRDKQPTF
jgi:hypothetical protein